MIREDVHRAIQNLPGHMHGGIYRYLEDGLPPGGFLTAVLTNNFIVACSRADSENKEHLFKYGQLLFVLPGNVWGSQDVVNSWIAAGGYNGIRKMKEMQDEC